MIWQGNPDLKSWWSGLLGPGQIFDTDRYCVVCANLLGSCYGSTGPQSTNPDTGRAYGYADFPRVNIRDSVAAHYRLVREGLGATSVAAVVTPTLIPNPDLHHDLYPDPNPELTLNPIPGP